MRLRKSTALPLGDDALGVQGLGHLAAGVQFQKQLEHPPHQLGLGAIDDVSLVHNVEAQYRLPADVLGQPGGCQLVVPDPFTDDLPLELRNLRDFCDTPSLALEDWSA